LLEPNSTAGGPLRTAWTGCRLHRNCTARNAGPKEEVAQLSAQEAQLRAVLDGRDAGSEVLDFLAEVRSVVLGPIRDAETMDALRSAFRRIYSGFMVYPAGSKEAITLAEDAGRRTCVLAPMRADDGAWLRESAIKVPLPVPANSYSTGFLLESLFAPITVGDWGEVGMTLQRVTYERCPVCERVLLWVGGELVCAFTECPGTTNAAGGRWAALADLKPSLEIGDRKAVAT
jgi:hypothetical protein